MIGGPIPDPGANAWGAPSPPDAGHLHIGHVVLSLPPLAAGHRIDGGSQPDSESSFCQATWTWGTVCLHPLLVNWFLRRRCHRVYGAGTLPPRSRLATVRATPPLYPRRLTTAVVRAMRDLASGAPMTKCQICTEWISREGKCRGLEEWLGGRPVRSGRYFHLCIPAVVLNVDGLKAWEGD